MDCAHDIRAFEDLYVAHRRDIEAYAMRRAPGLAADVVAETFTVAWRRFGDVPEDPLPWLYGVARNVLATLLRTAANAQRLTLRIQQQDVDIAPDPAIAVVASDHLRSVLETLSDTDREVLVLVAWEGLGPSEIAVALGISTIAAKVRLHRARKAFRRAFDASGTEDPVPLRTPAVTTVLFEGQA